MLVNKKGGALSEMVLVAGIYKARSLLVNLQTIFKLNQFWGLFTSCLSKESRGVAAVLRLQCFCLSPALILFVLGALFLFLFYCPLTRVSHHSYETLRELLVDAK